MKVVVALFGLVALALAQETSSYTGPMFDPDTAPHFGPSGIVYPSVTESAPVLSNLPTLTASRSSGVISMSSALANSTLSTSTLSLSLSLSRNATTSHSSTSSSTHSSTSVRTSRTATPTADETTSSASVPAETGAGVVNYPETFGALVGGLVAGWAML